MNRIQVEMYVGEIEAVLSTWRAVYNDMPADFSDSDIGFTEQRLEYWERKKREAQNNRANRLFKV